MGKTVCKGRHIPAATLDEIVLMNLRQRVLAPDCIAVLLKSLMERQTAKSESADLRLPIPSIAHRTRASNRLKLRGTFVLREAPVRVS
jgi:hypothetical protein